MHTNEHIHGGTWKDLRISQTRVHETVGKQKFTQKGEPAVHVHSGMQKIKKRTSLRTSHTIQRTRTARPEGIQTMSHHMVSSSCWIHFYIDEVGLCAFNLSVNEMLYQSISEKLSSVQVFIHQCLCI